MIAGPTASGKSHLALSLAQAMGGEIISADSICFYRGFNIGSAKPSPQEQALICHHLIDVLDAQEPADVSWFCQHAHQAIQSCHRRHSPAIIVGGSGLYLRALLNDQFHQLPSHAVLRKHLCSRPTMDLMRLLKKLDSHRASQIHPHDHFRLARACEINLLSNKTIKELTSPLSPYSTQGSPVLKGFVLRVIINPPRDQLTDQIHHRTHQMITQGIVDEVAGLLNGGVRADTKPMKSVGYKQTVQYLNESSASIDTLTDQIIIATRRLAKKQRNWFRNQPHDLLFSDYHHDEIHQTILDHLQRLK